MMSWKQRILTADHLRVGNNLLCYFLLNTTAARSNPIIGFISRASGLRIAFIATVNFLIVTPVIIPSPLQSDAEFLAERSGDYLDQSANPHRFEITPSHRVVGAAL